MVARDGPAEKIGSIRSFLSNIGIVLPNVTEASTMRAHAKLTVRLGIIWDDVKYARTNAVIPNIDAKVIAIKNSRRQKRRTFAELISPDCMPRITMADV